MKQRHDGQDEADKVKKRRVKYATYQRWQFDLDHEHQTVSWHNCITENESTRKVGAKVKCRVCTEFVNKNRYRKKFIQKWIVGADSVRINSVCHHAQMINMLMQCHI